MWQDGKLSNTTGEVIKVIYCSLNTPPRVYIVKKSLKSQSIQLLPLPHRAHATIHIFLLSAIKINEFITTYKLFSNGVSEKYFCRKFLNFWVVNFDNDENRH